jgi:hypothetical protein
MRRRSKSESSPSWPHFKEVLFCWSIRVISVSIIPSLGDWVDVVEPLEGEEWSMN